MAITRAIETVYRGRRFRSRLEARWAVFMDTLGVRWVYEREGYDLGAAGWYLPDFWLPEFRSWLEIKPQMPSDAERAKAVGLADQTGRLVFMFFDCEPPDWVHLCNFGRYFAPGGDWDGCMAWGICPRCGEICVGHLGGHSVFCRPTACEPYGGCCPGDVGGDDHPRLQAAWRAALGARFERGEKQP